MNKTHHLKLIIPFVVLIIISVCFVAYSTYSKSEKLLRESSAVHFGNILKETEHSIQAQLERLTALVVYMSKAPQTQTMLMLNTKHEARQQASERVRSTMLRLGAVSPYCANITFYDANGFYIMDRNQSHDYDPNVDKLYGGHETTASQAHTNVPTGPILPNKSENKRSKNCEYAFRPRRRRSR